MNNEQEKSALQSVEIISAVVVSAIISITIFHYFGLIWFGVYSVFSVPNILKLTK